MGTLNVDQIAADGGLVRDVDTTLTPSEKDEILLRALPGAVRERFAGVSAVRFHDHIIFKAQVTHLGFPWPEFKKRIQIPPKWLPAHKQALSEGLVPRFVGIYRYGPVTIFVDFEPDTYVQRKGNNSAAHVSTNDLHQAQTSGEFARVDANANSLTSVRADLFEHYLLHGYTPTNPRLGVFKQFNASFLTGAKIRGIDAVREMHDAAWPDRFQGEWPGFYVEYKLDSFIRQRDLGHLVEFRKVKRVGEFDYDLAFGRSGQIDYFGDLKASNIAVHESPGNDAADLQRCIETYGRFWYVIYEHETWHSRNDANRATIEWNRWRQSVGHKPSGKYDDLSYWKKFKEAVLFKRMKVLEVNAANFNVVLGDFAQGHQPSGDSRALKVMIKKRNIDNFLIFSAEI